MEREFLDLVGKVDQLTYFPEKEIEDYVWETRTVTESESIRGKKHWWSSKETFLGYRKITVVKTGWWRNSQGTFIAENDTDMYRQLRNSWCGNILGDLFTISEDKKITQHHILKIVTKNSNDKNKTVTYIYGYRTKNEAEWAIERICKANPNLVLTYTDAEGKDRNDKD